MKQKLHLTILRHSLLLVAMLMAVLPALSQQKRDIHELFNEPSGNVTRATGEVIDVNLDEWQSDYDTPINIANGRSYRFYNGVLRKKSDGTWKGGALIVLAKGSELKLDATATLEGGNLQTEDPVVEVKDATLNLTGGSVSKVYGWENPTPSTDGCTGVQLTDVENGVQNPYFSISSGSVTGRIENHTTMGHINLKGGTIGRISTSRDITMWGESQILTNLYFYDQSAKIILYSSLQHTLRLSNYCKDQLLMEGAVKYNVIESKSYIFYYITNDDLSKIVLGGDASKYYLSLEDNNVYVREKSSPILSLDDVEPGTLPDRIADPDNVEELTITGRLNGTDFYLLRQMGMKKLRKLDISGASVVEGGSAYYCDESNNSTRARTKGAPESMDMCESIESDGLARKKVDENGCSYTSNDRLDGMMFRDCTALEYIALPNTVTAIHSIPFYACTNLKTIVFGRNIAKIDIINPVTGCTSLTTINMNGNTNFTVDGGILYDKGKTAVYGTLSAVVGNAVNLPNTVKNIYWQTFINCKMKSISIPVGVTRIYSFTFSNCMNLETVTIAGNITDIGTCAFFTCSKLKSIYFGSNNLVFPSSLMSLGEHAFRNCSSLPSVDLSKTKLKEILYATFWECTSLKTLHLPVTLTNIKEFGFGKAPLTNIYAYPVTPPIITDFESDDGETFYSNIRNSCKVHVPKGSLSVYKAATGWKQFKSFAQDLPGVADYKTITNLEPGTLPDRIPEAYRNLIDELTITGKLNGTDINLIRQMANTNLKKLDISGCDIVEGGDAYLYHSDNHYSENNIIGNRMFFRCSVLENLILPHSAVAIGDEAFAQCKNLNKIVVGSSTKEFGVRLFKYLPNGIEKWSEHIGETPLCSVSFHNNPYVAVEGGIVYNSDYTKILFAFPYILVPDAKTYLTLRNTVSDICPYTFYEHDEIRKIRIPSSLKEIGEGVFFYCTKLTDVDFPECLESISSEAFAFCGLTSIDLSHTSVRSIDGGMFYRFSTKVGAFYGCNNLQTVYLPATLESMGQAVFTSEALSDVYSYASIPPILAYQDPNVMTGLTIFHHTFDGVNTETCRVHVPRGSLAAYKEAHGWKAFFQNMTEDLPGTGLQDGDTFTAQVGGGLTMTFKIISMADQTCQVGTGTEPAISTDTKGEVRIPGEVITDNGVFMVIKIANRAFKECKGLTKINLTEFITDIGTTDFENAMGAFHDCTGISSFDLPNSIKTIGRGTFTGCTKLTTLKIPESVTVIGTNAFDGCTNLTSIELSSNITEIPSESFRYCYQLTSIEIPAKVTAIGNNAFKDCNNLKEVISLVENPFTFDASAFATYDATLIVPVGTITAYQSTEAWKRFAKITDGTDPNLITDGDWLQKRLDEIAAEKPWQAVELRIADEGITLKHAVFASEGCKVRITGGKISIDPSDFTADLVFSIDKGSLVEFKDITFDFGNMGKPYFYYFINNGELIISENVVYENISIDTEREDPFYKNGKGGILHINSGDVTYRGTVLYNEGRAWIDSGTLRGVGQKPVLQGSGDDELIMHGGSVIGEGSLITDLTKFHVWGGRVQGDRGSTLVAERTDCSLGGGVFAGGGTYGNGLIGNDTPEFFPIFDLIATDRIDVTTKAQSVAAYGQLPEIFLAKDAVIGNVFFEYPTSTITLSINSDWSNMEEGHVIIERVPANYIANLKFLGLNDRMEIRYETVDEVFQCAKLHRLTLPEWIERQNQASQDTGTEDNPVEVFMPDNDDEGDLWESDEDLDLGRSDLSTGTVYRRVHYRWTDHSLRFNGSGWPVRPTLRLKRNIRIHKGSSLHLTRFYIDGMNTDKYIYVYGTLIIDVDVYIEFFRNRFIHVMPGGRVVWRGKRCWTQGYVIYNDGGTVTYEDGESESESWNGGVVNYGDGTVSISGGSITQGVYNHGKGTVNISGGKISGGVHNIGGGRINISGGSILCYNSSFDLPDVSNRENGTMWLTGGSIGENGDGVIRTEGDLWIGGGVQVGHIYMKRSVRIHIISKLTVLLRFHFFVEGEFDTDVPIIFGDDGYTLTKEDMKYIEIILPKGYRYELVDGKIVIKEGKPSIIPFFDDDNLPESTDEDDPYNPDMPDGADVDEDTELPDIHILFGSHDNSKQTGPITINDATLTVKSASTEFANIQVTGTGNGHIETTGKVIISEGTVVSGFKHFVEVKPGGSIVWRGGTTEGVSTVINNDGGHVELLSGNLNGEVRSNVSIWANGSVEVGQFVLLHGTGIYVTGRLTVSWLISFFTSDGARAAVSSDFTDGTPVLMSTEQYELTAEDLKHVTVELPEGWHLEYDELQKAIVIKSDETNNINGAALNDKGQMINDNWYDLKGRRISQPKKGVNILRDSSGKTKVVVVK